MPEVDYSDLNSFKALIERRNVVLQRLLGDPPAEIQQSDSHYTTSDGTSMRVKLYRPTDAPARGCPLIVMIHGGGFCIGMPESEEQTCRNLVQAFDAVCVSISYRLAPEFKFPHAPNDCWDALRWAASNAHSLGADPKLGFVVGGTSAGGNLAAVMALKARDEGLSPPLTGHYLSVPITGIDPKYHDRLLSMEQNKDAPILPVAALDMFMNGYQPDYEDRILYSIIAHPKGHQSLPPAFFQICGMDPLRDEALVYEAVYRENGVKTRLEMYPGCPHGFWGFFPSLRQSARYRKEQIEGIGWLLGMEPRTDKIKTHTSQLKI